jgi:hypothetical protein
VVAQGEESRGLNCKRPQATTSLPSTCRRVLPLLSSITSTAMMSMPSSNTGQIGKLPERSHFDSRKSRSRVGTVKSPQKKAIPMRDRGTDRQDFHQMLKPARNQRVTEKIVRAWKMRCLVNVVKGMLPKVQAMLPEVQAVWVVSLFVVTTDAYFLQSRTRRLPIPALPAAESLLQLPIAQLLTTQPPTYLPTTQLPTHPPTTQLPMTQLPTPSLPSARRLATMGKLHSLRLAAQHEFHVLLRGPGKHSKWWLSHCTGTEMHLMAPTESLPRREHVARSSDQMLHGPFLIKSYALSCYIESTKRYIYI